jgi:hypothetical protein
MHEFESIENAALIALAPLSGSLKEVDVLAGQLNKESLEKVSSLLPFIYVKATNLTSRTDNKTDRVEVSLDLFVGDKDVKAKDAASPGVYSLLVSVKGLLHKKKILAGWTPPVRVTEEELYYSSKSVFCVYRTRYTLKNAQ